MPNYNRKLKPDKPAEVYPELVESLALIGYHITKLQKLAGFSASATKLGISTQALQQKAERTIKREEKV